MKLLVFAHTPPPYHGQSLMVKLMLEGFAPDAAGAPPADAARPASASCAYDLDCYHVDARLSVDLEDIGRLRWQKAFQLLGYCAKALWLRVRNGVADFYFVPAPPKRSTLYRDWVVMLLCRLFFRRVIFHWHAVGLGDWLEKSARPWEHRISHLLLDRADLAVVLSRFNQADAEKFRPRRIEIVANGIPDPCPDYAQAVLPRRQARAALRRRLLADPTAAAASGGSAADDPGLVRVLYLAHCTRDKGLFDALQGVSLANERLHAQGSPLRLHLTVAGNFIIREDKEEFDRLLAVAGNAETVCYAGFIASEPKERALRQADLFCFPTFFANEGQPVNLIEAMAFGLPIVTTRWRSIPEFIPAGYPGLIEPRQPQQVGDALLALLGDTGEAFRATFLDHFTLERHLAALAHALRS